MDPTTDGDELELRPVASDNWRDVARLRVRDEQRHFVAAPSYYLALCCYGSDGWHPLAAQLGRQIVGFLMWAVDPADGSCWLGGVTVDREYQGRGLGRRLVSLALARLGAEGHRRFALSYEASNSAARRLYLSLGFEESGEMEGDEVVARLSLPAASASAPR